jgi:ketopantoate reductase
MKVLIVGAGAVGVVLGAHLKTRGHDVAFVTRTRRDPTAQAFQLRAVDGAETHRIDGPTVVVAGEPLAVADWVLVCVRFEQVDAALRSVASALGPHTRLGIAASLGRDDLRTAQTHAARAVVSITPGFNAWPDDAVDVWRWYEVPFAPTLVSGEGDGRSDEAARALAEALRGGGLRVRFAASAYAEMLPLFSSGLALLAALELSGWDVAQLAADGARRRLTARAMREAANVVRDESRGLAIAALRRTPAALLSACLALLPLLFRGRVRAMWSHHGPKIRAQTRAMLDDLLAKARARARSATALAALRDALPALPPG